MARSANFRHKETGEEVFIGSFSVCYGSNGKYYKDSKGNRLDDYEYIEHEREDYKGIAFNSSQAEQYKTMSDNLHKRAKEYDRTEGAKKKKDLIKKTVRATEKKMREQNNQ